MRKALSEPWSILQMHWVTAFKENALWQRHNIKPAVHVGACLRCHETQTTDRLSCLFLSHTNTLCEFWQNRLFNKLGQEKKKKQLLTGSPERWRPYDSALVPTADLWKVWIKSRQIWMKTVLMVICEGILSVELIFHCIQMSSGGTTWCIFDETRSLVVMDARCASADLIHVASHGIHFQFKMCVWGEKKQK